MVYRIRVTHCRNTCTRFTFAINRTHVFLSVYVYRIISYRVDINMRFRASSRSGLLLWSGRQSDPQEQRDENDDFLALGLDHGYLTLAYNLGSGEAVLRYNLTRLDDDLWHRIRAVRWEQTLREITLHNTHSTTVLPLCHFHYNIDLWIEWVGVYCGSVIQVILIIIINFINTTHHVIIEYRRKFMSDA